MPNNNSLPGFTLMRQGVEIPPQLVYSVSIEFGFSTIPKATVLINDGSWAKQNFDESEKDEWQIGEKLDLKIGYNLQHSLVFSGIIIKQSIAASEQNTSQLCLELRSPIYLMAIKKYNRIFLDKKDSDSLDEIMNEYGFSKEIDATSEIQRQMIQFNSTDWDFLNMRAEANAMYVIPNNEKIVIKKNIVPDTEKTVLKFGNNISKIDLETDGRYNFEEYHAKTWDADNLEIIDSEPSSSSNQTAGKNTSAEIAEKTKHGKLDISGLGSLSEMEAVQIVNFQKSGSELKKIRGTIKCIGNLDAEIGDWIKLEGVGSQFNGKVLVTGVLHELSAGRWYTTYQVGTPLEKFAERFTNIIDRPASGLLPSVNGLQIGIVQDLESSENDECILVQLPNVKENEEAVWARCARMDAGNNRGWVFRPEIGDEVILGFINDDPRQAIILGALHSSKNTAPFPAKNDNPIKGYYSRENIQFLFDDENKIATLKTPDSTIELNDTDKKITIKNTTNSIEMSENGIKLETQKDLKIKADGSVEIEGMNITIKASAQFEAEGNSGTKISSSAITQIKGSMVNIN